MHQVFSFTFQTGWFRSTKYAPESLYHLFHVYAMLTPRKAERVKLNCTVNTKGGAGNNLFLNLDLENDNHYVTELLRGLGATVSEISVNRICRALFLIVKLFQRLACEWNIFQNSGEHTKKNLHRDLMTVVEELVREDVFIKKTDREPLRFFFTTVPKIIYNS